MILNEWIKEIPLTEMQQDNFLIITLFKFLMWMMWISLNIKLSCLKKNKVGSFCHLNWWLFDLQTKQKKKNKGTKNTLECKKIPTAMMHFLKEHE